MTFLPSVVIPVFNHDGVISARVDSVLALGLPCILVDDGSGPACAAALTQLAAAHAGRVTLVRHARNRGKGAAVMSGIARAHELGRSHALQIDADDQHMAADIPAFLDLARKHPAAIIAGQPIFDESVPAARLYFRYLTHILVWIDTMSLEIRDSMCGFRVYPVAPVLELSRRVSLGNRMDFDSEILVRSWWEGTEIISHRTQVRYPRDGVSHFRMFRDNVFMTRMHIRLLLGMLVRSPRLVSRLVTRQATRIAARNQTAQ
jgi:glycosyltransferase involved in cell wall biosynthesis